MFAIENFISYEVVQKIGWVLLHFTWQAAAVAFVLAFAMRILRRFSANTRYITACLALLFVVVIPFATMQFIKVSTPPAAPAIAEVSAPAIEPVTALSEITFNEPAEKPVKVVYLEPITEIAEPQINWKERIVTFLEPKLSAIVTLWLLGVFALAIWHLGGYAQLQKLRKKMVKQVDSSLNDKLKVLAHKLRITQTVELLESALVQIPTVVGWLKPVILLPASALTGLTTEQLKAILAHELAHIKRYDYLVNILQTIVEILGFYHPAVWWISRKIRNERENCCDDIAVAICGDKIHYAKALASMEEIRSRDQFAIAATGGNLFSRICRLLGKDSNEKNALSWIPALTVILLLIALAIPTTIAFTSSRNVDPNSTQIEKMLIDGFRENRDKFKCGILAWNKTTINDGLGSFSDEKYETKGSFQLWWDEEKIATRYVDERLYGGERGSGIEAVSGGNIYDADILSRKPKYSLYENWFEQVIRWTGPLPLDKDIAEMKKLKNISLDWSIIDSNEGKQIKLTGKNMDDGYFSVKYFDISKGYNLIRDESHNTDGKLYSLQTRKLKQVGDGWFPVEVDMKSFDTKTSKVTLDNHFALDLKQCSFNERDVLPKGIFDLSTAKEHEQLNKIIEKYTKNETTYDDNLKKACNSVFNYMTAVMSKQDEEAVKFAYPESSISHSDDNDQMREILKGQQVKIITVYADDWNALVTSSVILGDHGRIGPLVFQLKRFFLEQKEYWLIDDIDIETIDSIEEEYDRFLKENSNAKILKLKEPISIPLDIKNENNANIQSENIKSNTKVLIEAQFIQADDLLLNQIGLLNDPNYLKYSNTLDLTRVDDSDNPFIYKIDSSTEEILLTRIDDSKNASYVSHLFMMSTSGQEVTIKTNSDDKFKPKELGRFIKVKPQLTQDGANINVSCELITRHYKNLDLNITDLNDVPESEIIENQNHTGNAILSDENTLLILSDKPVSSQNENNNEIILIKAIVVPDEQGNNGDSQDLSDNVFTSQLVRINFDLNLLEPGQFVEIKNNGKRDFTIIQVPCPPGKKFPCYGSNIDFDIRSNLDFNLATKRYSRGPLSEHGKWDAHFTGPNTVSGNGDFSTTTLSVSASDLNLYQGILSNTVLDDTQVSLVEVQIQPVKSENLLDAQWGQDVDGLRASVEFIPDKESYSLGERIGIRFKIQNVSNKDIQIAYSELLDSFAEITNGRGEDVSRPSPYNIGSGWPRITRIKLKPNETMTLNNFGLGFGLQNDPALVKEVLLDPNDYTTREFNQLEPGQYSIRYKISLPNTYIESIYEENNVPQPDDWQGTLNTQLRKINLTEKQSLLSNSNKGNSDSDDEQNMIGPSPNEFIINSSENTSPSQEPEETPEDGLIQRTYDISDLVGMPSMQGIGSGGMMGGMMSGMGGGLEINPMPGSSYGTAPNQAIINATREFIQKLMESVEPDSWYEKNNKAQGTVFAYPANSPKKLAVTNTPEIQTKVEEYLETLRESIDYTLVAIETRYIYGNEQAINEILKSIGIRESGAANLEDAQVTKLIKGIQGNQNVKLMALPKVTVLNDETAVFQNMVQQPVSPEQINPFFKITPHISEDKDIVFITFDDKRPLEWNDSNRPPDITTIGLETKLTIINGKTCAFSFDGNNQKDLSSDKKSLIMIKATIVPPEEDKQENTGSITTVNPEMAPQSVSNQSSNSQNEPNKVLIETQLIQVSSDFLKQIGLDANSMKKSDTWSKYSIDNSNEPNIFVLDELSAALLKQTIDTNKDAKVKGHPAIVAATGKQAVMKVLTEDYYILKNNNNSYIVKFDSLGMDKDSKIMANRQELFKFTSGTAINLVPEIIDDNIQLELEINIGDVIANEQELKVNEITISDGTKPKDKIQQKLPKEVTLFKESFNVLIPSGKSLLIIGNEISSGITHESKVPILGDLPLLDRVFSSRSNIKNEYIQLFLVKPTILSEEEVKEYTRNKFLRQDEQD